MTNKVKGEKKEDRYKRKKMGVTALAEDRLK